MRREARARRGLPRVARTELRAVVDARDIKIASVVLERLDGELEQREQREGREVQRRIHLVVLLPPLDERNDVDRREAPLRVGPH